MKSIRNIAFSALLTLGAFSAITYASCSKDECEDVVCQNGGTCVDGSCVCSSGYEGTNCEIKSNAKFVGTWSVTETCGSATSNPYQVTITADGTDATKVLVSNLGNYGCTQGGTIVFDGLVNGATLTINDNACATQMNATGNYANGKITFNYTASYGVTTDNCTATLSK
ncbi:calcium-binding EGF-like domain-containing protein [Polluticoccus soli]|uniref:calcium-binding EGF-like domain-containing protein n=1 Tax=Polluticoccus soli TaxID=3034150 RepID=UPI0023E0C1C4|nr:calcium-binding EGF-like domain-containing protein [Flavipsychrobacter sp. JY13-12]